ncbi:MAG: histidine phosphatase family protein [Intestinibacter sp.]
MNIYLIRHGKLNWKDHKKKCIGITDVELSQEGIEKARENGVFLKDKNIKKIYTSDLSRCKKSAEIISNYLNIPYFIDRDLREIDMGIWENKSFSEIKKLYPLEYEERGNNIASFDKHGGESFEKCFERAEKALNKLAKENKDENIVLLTHSGIIKCLIAYIDKIPLNDILSIKQEYGAINVISFENNKFRILQRNI